MRLRLLLLVLAAGAAPGARADYAVLRNGQRLHITGYERRDNCVELRLNGGVVEISAADLVSIEPEEFLPVARVQKPAPPVVELVEAAARRYGVDPELVTSVIAVESNFDPRAVSRRDARGLMQLLPETATRLGVTDVFDPVQNVDAGTRYLKTLLDSYRFDLVLALAAYNAGPDRVEQFRGVPPFIETISYVRRVRREYQRRKSLAAARKRPPNPTPAPLEKPINKRESGS